MGERLRGRAGQVARKRRLDAEPACRRCRDRGFTTIATVPDHIQPLALGGLDVDDNIRCLCEPCHLEVTAEEFGHSEPIKARGISRSGRPTSPDHPWNRDA
jgi:5-methylcytosine-specific restriction protein A